MSGFLRKLNIYYDQCLGSEKIDVNILFNILYVKKIFECLALKNISDNDIGKYFIVSLKNTNNRNIGDIVSHIMLILNNKSQPISKQMTTEKYVNLNVQSKTQKQSNHQNNPTIIPSFYKGNGKIGDFMWMINQKEFNDSLFIFNDNVNQMLSSTGGGGNASIRPYNKYGTYKNYPRSAGIPTGYYGSHGGKGFDSLDEIIPIHYSKINGNTAKDYINFSIKEIKDLILDKKYKRIYFSAGINKNTGKIQLGTSIFAVNQEVIDYITEEIFKLGNIE